MSTFSQSSTFKLVDLNRFQLYLSTLNIWLKRIKFPEYCINLKNIKTNLTMTLFLKCCPPHQFRNKTAKLLSVNWLPEPLQDGSTKIYWIFLASSESGWRVRKSWCIAPTVEAPLFSTIDFSISKRFWSRSRAITWLQKRKKQL